MTLHPVGNRPGANTGPAPDDASSRRRLVPQSIA
jgi:hypothetical protein